MADNQEHERWPVRHPTGDELRAASDRSGEWVESQDILFAVDDAGITVMNDDAALDEWFKLAVEGLHKAHAAVDLEDFALDILTNAHLVSAFWLGVFWQLSDPQLSNDPTRAKLRIEAHKNMLAVKAAAQGKAD